MELEASSHRPENLLTTLRIKKVVEMGTITGELLITLVATVEKNIMWAIGVSHIRGISVLSWKRG